MPRPALYTLVMCVLAIAATVVSFARGSWFGIVWILIVGVTSNMAWFYLRRAKMEKQQRAAEHTTG